MVHFSKPLGRVIASRLLSFSRGTKRGLAITFDIAVCVASAWLAFSLPFAMLFPFTKYPFWPVIVAIALFLPVFMALGIYRAIFRYSGGAAVLQIAIAVGIYGAIYFVLFALVGFKGIPRSIGLTQPTLFFLFVAASRLVLPRLLSTTSTPHRHRALPGVIIYGAGDAGRQLANSVSASTQRRFIAFLDDDENLWNSTVDGKRVYAPPQLQRLIQTTQAAELWLAMPSLSGSERRQLFDFLRHYL